MSGELAWGASRDSSKLYEACIYHAQIDGEMRMVQEGVCACGSSLHYALSSMLADPFPKGALFLLAMPASDSKSQTNSSATSRSAVQQMRSGSDALHIGSTFSRRHLGVQSSSDRFQAQYVAVDNFC